MLQHARRGIVPPMGPFDAVLGSTLRRFAILGDVHAEHETLARFLDFLRDQEVDAILAVGDILDGPGDVNACCRLLTEGGVRAVRGNHERWFLNGTMRALPDATQERDVDASSRAFLAALPLSLRIRTTRGDMLLCHATGDDDMHAVGPDDFGYALETNDELQKVLRDGSIGLLVCGHTHRRMVRRIGALTVVNAGTLRRGESPGFGVVDLGDPPHVTFFERSAEESVVVAEVITLPS
jgi:predicted phosphodiesterase